MRRFLLLLALLLCALTPTSLAVGNLYIDGRPVDLSATVLSNTTYVSLRTMTEVLRPDSSISWGNGQVTVRAGRFTLSAAPGNLYLEANGRTLFAPLGVLVKNGHVLVPVRTLAAALDAKVAWDAKSGNTLITSGSGAIVSAGSFYDSSSLYWLSHIISAESQSEPMTGKIAVGNVVLNRVASSEFPNTIHDVIFDGRWGGQFEPVRNGTINLTPTAESIVAAKLVLEGANVAGSSLYFLAPSLTSNHWIMQNQTYVMTIGSHWFYQ